MTTMTQQLQPAIGLNGLNALNHAAKITNAYSVANMKQGEQQSSKEKKVSITDKIPLVGHWANRILHKYSAFKPLAKTVDGYDDTNRKYAQKEFSLALANGPATREGRQSLAYHTWGYLCDTGHDLLDLGSNIASLYSFYIDISQALAVALAPVTEGVTLLALPELEASKVASEVLSTGLAVSAAEAGTAFLNYRAVQSQDGVGTVAEILSGYQENTTERLFAYVSWALKEFKFLSPKRQLKTIKNAGSFMSRASQWSARMTKLLGDKISKDLPGVAKAASWAKQIYEMYGYLKKAKDVGKSLWALIKDPAKMLWKTAKFGLDVGKRAVKGAVQMGVHAGKWLGHKAHEAGQGITHAAHDSAKWIGSKAQAAGQWIGGKAQEFGHGMLQNREWIGEVLHQSSDIFSVLSAVTGVTATGLALLGIGLPVVLPFAAGLGVASGAFAAAAAASHAWYSTMLAVGTLDGSVPVSKATGEAWGATGDLALLGVGSAVTKIEALGDSARGMAQGETAASAAKSSRIAVSDEITNRKTLGSLNQLTLTLKRLHALPLQKVLKDVALAKRLQWLTIALKAADFASSVVGFVTAPLNAAARAAAAGKFVLDKGKAAAQAVGHWGAQKAQQVGSFAKGMASKASSAVGSMFGSLSHKFGLSLKALPEVGFENTGDEQAARKLERTIAAPPVLASAGPHPTVGPARHGHSAPHPSAGFLARNAQFHGIMDAAQAAGDPHPEITAAQWALESGWGKKVTGTHNYFGQKAAATQPGSQHATHEQVSGKRIATTARFRDYATTAEGVADHVTRWNSPGYAAATTDAAAIADLQKRHYATDADYSGKLLPIIRRYAGGAGATQEAARLPDALQTIPTQPRILQRKGRGDHPDVNPVALRDDLRKQSTGFVPDSNVRAKLGGHLGFDPGGARLHTGPAAASASRALNAEAFTIGNDVFFGDGRFDPHSPKGLGLIAHELTHVGQQTGTTGNKARFFTQEGGDAMEREAQQTAEHVLANVGSRQGLFVEDYVREYEGEGNLSQDDQKRLDRISVLALDQAQKMLAARGVRRSINADALDVQVEIDLGEMSDGEAAQVWAEAIVAAMPSGQTAARGKKTASSATTIMRSPGDNIVDVDLSDSEGNIVDVSPEGKHYLSVDPQSGNPHNWNHSTSNYKPSLLMLNPNAMFNSLMAQVVAVKDEQRTYADKFHAAKDMKYWFARVYQHVTEHEIEAITNNAYQYPLMKMQEVLGFSATYKANIDAWLEGNQKNVESNWKAAFAQAETGNAGGGFFSSAGTRVKNALLPSMQAHIRFDLPRAIASVYNQNYLGIPNTSLEDFHQDFNAMGPVFDAAQADLAPEIDSWKDGNAWLLGPVGNWHLLPGFGAGKGFGPGTNIMGSPFDQIFDVQKERAEAWDKAGMVSNAMQKGESRDALQGEIADKFRDGALQVGGFFSSNQWRSTKVEDYDWLHQPGASSVPVRRAAQSGTPADPGSSERAAITLEEAVVAGMPSDDLPRPMDSFASPLRIQRKPAATNEHLRSAYFGGDATLEKIYHGASALRRPSHGKSVSKVQQALSDLGFRLPESGVDADYGKETEKAVQSYQTARSLDPDGKVGPDTLRALETDFNAAPKAAPEIAATEASLGQNVVSDMNKANNPDLNSKNKVAADSGVWYQYNYRDAYPKKWSVDLLYGYANPIYFDRMGGFDWLLKPKRSASAAIKAWLKGLTIAECLTSVVAMEYDSIRAAIGDQKFDQIFGSATADIPEANRLRIKQNVGETPLAHYLKSTDAALKNDAGSDNKRPAKAGEWYYFYNHPQYLLKHPGGAWQGENSIFMGVDAAGNQLWAGLGASNVTEKGMYQEMVDAYNGARDEDDYRALRARFPGVDPKNHPEQLPLEYQEGGGVFPSVIAATDVLNAPPYTIDNVTRKGGFSAAAGHALDTAKVQKSKDNP